ncbi:molybdenum cofactor guanylyltransferase [Dyella acidisoli]|uniref:Molybdenum cofactor guanylyltransferase n=1 Tax=Dyella acidisoli TaxID=1867834 RepID=A0ABQ5XUM9_9GAMM|nr:molybdenum cofactor guanylyltransferase [Dyella acidisoli]GLQ95489.1 molybdenum cofactor guanylyltransferase [Dyella acidisoli]
MGTTTITAAKSLPCIGVVLAGGLSSRMGRDKALLPWNGHPLIEHQIAVLQATGVREVKVSGDRPNYHGVIDPVPQAGPVGGIAGIAATCEDSELLIVPVDMPQLQPSLLQRLLTAASTSGCVRFTDHVLPMRLRLDSHCRDALDALLAANDKRYRSLRALQERVGIHEISLSAAEVTQLIDCNTEETWRELNT